MSFVEGPYPSLAGPIERFRYLEGNDIILFPVATKVSNKQTANSKVMINHMAGRKFLAIIDWEEGRGIFWNIEIVGCEWSFQYFGNCGFDPI